MHETSSAIDNELSSCKKIRYRALVFVGYGSLVVETAYSKFLYDTNVSGITHLSKIFFHKDCNSIVVSAFAAIFAGLNLAVALTAISPTVDAKKLLRETVSQHQENPECSTEQNYRAQQIKKAIHFLLTTAIPGIAMLINFSIGASASWLGVYDWLSSSASINYTVGPLITLIGFSYYILLSSGYIINNAHDFTQLNKSIIKKLFVVSK